MDIQTLALADERATICGQIDNLLLADLPDRLVDSLDIVGNASDLLNRSSVSNDHVLHLVIPQLEIHEFTKEPWAHDLELSSENTTRVDVAASTH